jgi:hypothetical protein
MGRQRWRSRAIPEYTVEPNQSTLAMAMAVRRLISNGAVLGRCSHRGAANLSEFCSHVFTLRCTDPSDQIRWLTTTNRFANHSSISGLDVDSISGLRPYYAENTGSHPNPEVKLHQAELVLGWGTTLEPSVLQAFSFFHFIFHFLSDLFNFGSYSDFRVTFHHN